MTGTWGRFWPTKAWVRLALGPALVFIALAADRNYLADFWHHLARGRAILAEGQLVDRDLFTFTIPGQRFQDVNWLAQIFYYGLFQLGGLDLVRPANALLLAGAMGLLVLMCRRRSGSLGTAAALGVFVFFGLWQILTIRPQTFSLLLFVVLYDLLDRAGKKPWLLAAAPALLGLWANLHGAFPAGLMLIGCFLLAAAWQGWKQGRLFRHPRTWALAGCLAASVAATLVNPYGWGIYQFVRHNSSTSAARRIDEWLPPSLDLWIGWAWLVSLLALGIFLAAAWIRKQSRPAARDVILMACFLPLTFLAVRMVAWWLIVTAPMAAGLLVEWFPRFRDRPEDTGQTSWGAGLAFAVLMILAVMSIPGLQRYNPLLAARQTVPHIEDDLEAIHQRLPKHFPGGRIFSSFEWGEYLSWSFAPDYRVFMDGRIEIYPDRVWQQYSAITLGKPDWQKILDAYQVDVLLLDGVFHARSGLLPRVEESPAWKRIDQAGQALVYVRR